jgi:hypothetical protein
MTALEQYRIFNQISVIAIVGETFAPPGSTLATLRREVNPRDKIPNS